MTVPHSQSDVLPPIRVLSVDDNAPLRASLRTIFALEEAIDLVGEAADGREGVERAVALRPDVVMLDIQMPVMNGIEAARQIKQRLPETKIVFFVAEVIWRTQAQAAGADAFLLKDTPIATVVDTILRVAGRTVPAEPERLPAPEAGIPPPPAPAPTPVRAPAPAAPVPPGLPVRPLPGRGVRRPRRPTSVPPAAARQPQAPGAPPPPVIPPPRQSLEVLAEAMSGSFPTPASGVMGAEGRRDLVALVRRIRTAADRLDQIGDELEAAVGPAGPGAVFAGPLPAPADEIAARTRREVVRALMDLAQSLAVIGQEPVAALLQTLQGRFASPTAEPPQASPAGGLALPLIQPPQPPTDWGYEALAAARPRRRPAALGAGDGRIGGSVASCPCPGSSGDRRAGGDNRPAKRLSLRGVLGHDEVHGGAVADRRGAGGAGAPVPPGPTRCHGHLRRTGAAGRAPPGSQRVSPHDLAAGR